MDLLFVAVIGILIVGAVLWLIFRVLSIDWLGIYYDDPTSPYYHDKHGKGRGHHDR